MLFTFDFQSLNEGGADFIQFLIIFVIAAIPSILYTYQSISNVTLDADIPKIIHK